MRGMNQVDLAKASGVAQNTISEIELGKREARPGTLKKLAEALGVEISDLLGADSPKAQAPLPLEFEAAGAERRRKGIYLPWLEFAGRYADRVHEKARQGKFDRGAYLEWKETVHDIAATARKLQEEEERGLSPEEWEERQDDLIMWQVMSRVLGTLASVLDSQKELYDKSDLEQLRRERNQLEEWRKTVDTKAAGHD